MLHCRAAALAARAGVARPVGPASQAPRSVVRRAESEASLLAASTGYVCVDAREVVWVAAEPVERLAQEEVGPLWPAVW